MSVNDTPTTEVTVGVLGEGEQTILLSPGESIERSFDGPAYVEVRSIAPATDGATAEVPEQTDTTYEQERETNDDDRVWDVDARSCDKCGKMYPDDYTMCPECGHPNPDI